MSDNQTHMDSGDYTIPDDARNPFDECSEAYEALETERDRLRKGLKDAQRVIELIQTALKRGNHDVASYRVSDANGLIGDALRGEEADGE